MCSICITTFYTYLIPGINQGLNVKAFYLLLYSKAHRTFLLSPVEIALVMKDFSSEQSPSNKTRDTILQETSRESLDIAWEY